MNSVREIENDIEKTKCANAQLVERLEEAFKKEDTPEIQQLRPVQNLKPEAKHIDIKQWLANTLVTSICLTILMGIVLPCFVGAQDMAKASSVKGNMRTVQIAAESFATDNRGIYAQSLDQLLPYFPNGSQTIGGKPGILPSNPVSGNATGVVQGFKAVSSKQIRSIQQTLAGSSDLRPGQVSYSPSTDCKSYAIMGAGPNGMAVSGVGGFTLLLSNQ